jgi:HSP20 family protein
LTAVITGLTLSVDEARLAGRLAERFEDLPSRLMERLDRLLGRWEPGWAALRWPEEALLSAPAVDVYEDGDMLVIETELPGVKKEQIEVKLTGNMLTISGTREEERKNYLRLERCSGAVTRTIRLPVDVVADGVTATLKDGVLEVRAPKTEAARSSTKTASVT